jgi:hypothetical protein
MPTIQFAASDWNATFTADLQDKAVTALEDGKVLFFPELSFSLVDGESRFLTPELVGDAKNVSYNFATRKLGRCTGPEADKAAVAAMIHRFADQAKLLMANLLPAYAGKLTMGRASLRPVEAAGRNSSWRKDDTRLHVDSFPSTPVNGQRILRAFSNVNPAGRPRSWRIGEPFAEVSKRFVNAVPKPFPGTLTLMQLLKVTKGRRSLYDHYMLALHDAMKSNDEYQRTCPQKTFDFPAQSTWITYTDGVPHAVTSGQHQFEQTFYLDAHAMVDPEKSPLRILEKQLGKNLRN